MSIVRNQTLASRRAKSWSPTKLYNLDRDHRRVLLLEAIAAQIVKMETFRTREDFEAFRDELKESRENRWGRRPWPRAMDAAGYLEHVADLARTFADAKGSADYASRSVAP